MKLAGVREGHTSAAGLDQKREIEAEIGRRTGRLVNLKIMCRERLLQCRVRNFYRHYVKNRNRMMGRLCRDKLIATGHCSLTAVVGI